MGRKPKREAKDTDYVSNDRLRELIIEYNDTNPADNGEWLDRFEKTMKTKGKYESVRTWIDLRRQKYAKPREYTPRFEKVSDELFRAVYKIAQGRIACFSGIPADEKDDILQDCMLAVTQYINRYREDIESSAFAYLTQIISNALKLHMGQHNDSMWCRIPWSEITDECASLLYGHNDGDEPYSK